MQTSYLSLVLVLVISINIADAIFFDRRFFAGLAGIWSLCVLTGSCRRNGRVRCVLQ